MPSSVIMVTPLAEHMGPLLQLSSEQLDQMLIVTDNARLLSPSAPSPISIATTTLPPLFDQSYSDMTMIRKVTPPNGKNTFTQPLMKLSRWNDNDSALAPPSSLPRPPIYWPDTTRTASSSSSTSANTSPRPHAYFKRSTSDRSIIQRPPLSMTKNNSPNNKGTSRWESSSPTLNLSSQQRVSEGNSLVLVRQSSDSALVCPVRMSSYVPIRGTMIKTSSPSIPERRASSDSLGSAGVDRITDTMEMECEDDAGSDGAEE